MIEIRIKANSLIELDEFIKIIEKQNNYLRVSGKLKPFISKDHKHKIFLCYENFMNLTKEDLYKIKKNWLSRPEDEKPIITKKGRKNNGTTNTKKPIK